MRQVNKLFGRKINNSSNKNKTRLFWKDVEKVRKQENTC